MPPALELALIVTLAVLLAITSATSAVLWFRTRTVTRSEADRLADIVADCRRVLDSILERTNVPHPIGSATPRPLASSPTRRIDRGGRRVPAGPTLIAVPDLSTASVPRSASTELGTRFGAVWELADAGTSAEAMARRTGQPIGQVELILGLRRQLLASGGPP